MGPHDFGTCTSKSGGGHHRKQNWELPLECPPRLKQKLLSLQWKWFRTWINRFVNSGNEACICGSIGKRLYRKGQNHQVFQDAIMAIVMPFLSKQEWCSNFWDSNSPGVTQGTAKDTLLARFNDLEDVRKLSQTILMKLPQSSSNLLRETWMYSAKAGFAGLRELWRCLWNAFDIWWGYDWFSFSCWWSSRTLTMWLPILLHLERLLRGLL